MNELFREVINLKKVGPKTSLSLKKIGIIKIGDLIHYYPRNYEKIKFDCDIGDLTEGDTYYISGRVNSRVTLLRIKGKLMVQFNLCDETGQVRVTFFNQPYIAKQISFGDEIIVKGKYIIKNNRKIISGPKIIKKEEFQKLISINVKPLYTLTKDITENKLNNYIKQSLEIMKTNVDDYLTKDIREKYQLCDLEFAYEKIHYPINDKNLAIARKRLAFDEIFLFLMVTKRLREYSLKIKNKFRIEKTKHIEEYIEKLPYNLTNAQLNAIEDIFEDMKSEKTMSRLVQGDVGSGKTVIAIIALLATAFSGYQSAFMAPTEVLARQHFEGMKNEFLKYGIKVELLTSSITKKNKEIIYEKLKNKEIDIIVGTHAIIQEKIEFNNLALVITDEQHRFGVRQRETLVSKGKYPHTLVMSATPIPRTLALIMYGDLDISIINELPSERIPVTTYLVSSNYEERFLKFVAQEAIKGYNIYIVCPMVEQAEESSLHSVEHYSKVVQSNMPNGINVGFLHGKMKAKEKDEMIQNFCALKINVLVSTTVIEVGVNVPNATLMVIMDADRFGLAQLHQLRGRVGRGSIESYCVLVSDTKNKETYKKLKFLKNHNNGFDIAEYDLKTRGPGEAFGVMQHGGFFFKIADIYQDKELIEKARELSQQFEINNKLKKHLELFYNKWNVASSI